MPSEQTMGTARGELAVGSCCLAVSGRLAGHWTGSYEAVSWNPSQRELQACLPVQHALVDISHLTGIRHGDIHRSHGGLRWCFVRLDGGGLGSQRTRAVRSVSLRCPRGRLDPVLGAPWCLACRRGKVVRRDTRERPFTVGVLPLTLAWPVRDEEPINIVLAQGAF